MNDERQALAARLLGPGRFEIGCDACFDRLDEYVDTEVRGGDPEHAVRGMRAHLDGCAACEDDYRSLRDLVRMTRSADQPGRDPG